MSMIVNALGRVGLTVTLLLFTALLHLGLLFVSEGTGQANGLACYGCGEVDNPVMTGSDGLSNCVHTTQVNNAELLGASFNLNVAVAVTGHGLTMFGLFGFDFDGMSSKVSLVNLASVWIMAVGYAAETAIAIDATTSQVHNDASFAEMGIVAGARCEVDNPYMVDFEETLKQAGASILGVNLILTLVLCFITMACGCLRQAKEESNGGGAKTQELTNI
jgi:hypothetical protein